MMQHRFHHPRPPPPPPLPASTRSHDPLSPPPPPQPLAVPPHKKARQIVTWTPQDDERLREQVALHGTGNWASIANDLKDKSSRQCKRRWYTYLNTEGKKGGWSAEEDMILCAAQKIFGNRWTDIAKLVSGRTDNAVKNRFSTLCKKRAKHGASSKENNGPFGDQKNKRVITHNGLIVNGITEAPMPTMHARYGISNLTENHSTHGKLFRQQVAQEEQLRPPLAVLVQNINRSVGLPTQVPLNYTTKATVHGVSGNKVSGAFSIRDNPKLNVLMQQRGLLDSLAVKVNIDSTSESHENALKELEDYLIQTEEIGSLRRKMSGMDFIMGDSKDLIEDMKSTNIEYQQSRREHDLHEESQGNSECSTGSSYAMNSRGSRSVGQHTEECLLNDNTEGSGVHDIVLCPISNSGQGTRRSENVQQAVEYSQNHETEIHSLLDDVLSPETNDQAPFLPSSEESNGNENICILPNSEFSSPLQTMPPFQSLAEGLPSLKFSASERQFLLSVFGMSSPICSPRSIREPPCKRALLDSL